MTRRKGKSLDFIVPLLFLENVIETIMKLTAIIYPDSETDLLVAECPEIGTASQGHTETEALENLKEATELYVESFPHFFRKQSVIYTFELTNA